MNIMVQRTDAQKPGITYDDYVNYGLSESRLSEWSSTSPNNQPVTDEFKKLDIMLWKIG